MLNYIVPIQIEADDEIMPLMRMLAENALAKRITAINAELQAHAGGKTIHVKRHPMLPAPACDSELCGLNPFGQCLVPLLKGRLPRITENEGCYDTANLDE